MIRDPSVAVSAGAWFDFARILGAVVAIVSVVGLATPALGSRTTPMYVMKRRPLGVEAGVSMKALEESIVFAIELSGARATVRRPGLIDSEWSKGNGKHSALVEVLFDAESFEIRYVESSNLGYDPDRCISRGKTGTGRRRVCGPVIHPIYNEWVHSLEAIILKRVNHAAISEPDSSNSRERR